MFQPYWVITYPARIYGWHISSFRSNLPLCYSPNLLFYNILAARKPRWRSRVQGSTGHFPSKSYICHLYQDTRRWDLFYIYGCRKAILDSKSLRRSQRPIPRKLFSSYRRLRRLDTTIRDSNGHSVCNSLVCASRGQKYSVSLLSRFLESLLMHGRKLATFGCFT